MRGWSALIAIVALAVPALAPCQDVQAPAANGAKVWPGRYAEFEEYLRTAPIERVEDVGEGVTKPRRAYFAPGGLVASAIVKKLPPRLTKGYWESYKSEIAAYELDRVLGLDMVPVTVERRFEGDRVSMQQWLPGCALLRDKGSAVPTRPRDWARQVCRQKIFDAMVANIDRNSGNILVDTDFNLILIDHSRAFAKDQAPFMDEIKQTDREFFEAIKGLNEAELRERVGPWLFDEDTVRALLRRRDRIVEKLERRMAEFGELAVFPF